MNFSEEIEDEDNDQNPEEEKFNENSDNEYIGGDEFDLNAR